MALQDFVEEVQVLARDLVDRVRSQEAAYITKLRPRSPASTAVEIFWKRNAGFSKITAINT